jgi:predicted TIM-barrel fold metal-dependent hydrolase
VLIDVHAHFHHPAGQRADWAERNASRLRAGEQIGITWHVASILGTWGRSSPTYFPSPGDVVIGNDALLALVRQHPDRIRGYACVNPNDTHHAVAEIRRCRAAGMIGVKLAASRRADDPLLDPIAEEAQRLGLPILHHVWQHRRREWPGQEASDAVELGALAARHPAVPFILAHIGGGGDWLHSLRAVRSRENVFVDLSGSGVDGGMLEACLDAVGAGRLLWGCDVTMDTGWAKLRYLGRLVSAEELERIRWRNAAAIFPPGSFERVEAADRKFGRRPSSDEPCSPPAVPPSPEVTPAD